MDGTATGIWQVCPNSIGVWHAGLARWPTFKVDKGEMEYCHARSALPARSQGLRKVDTDGGSLKIGSSRCSAAYLNRGKTVFSKRS